MKVRKMLKRHDAAKAHTKAVAGSFYPHEGFRRDRISLEYHLLRAMGIAEVMSADSEDLCRLIGMALAETENLTVKED